MLVPVRLAAGSTENDGSGPWLLPGCRPGALPVTCRPRKPQQEHRAYKLSGLQETG